MDYVPRRLTGEIEAALGRQAAVALLGPRQSGKTTLARRIAGGRDAVYLDLELSEDRRRLEDVAGFVRAHEDRLVVLDEIHRAPDLFPELRGHIDAGRRKGKGTGRFLVLGSASTRSPPAVGEPGRANRLRRSRAARRARDRVRSGFRDAALGAGRAASQLPRGERGGKPAVSAGPDPRLSRARFPPVPAAGAGPAAGAAVDHAGAWSGRNAESCAAGGQPDAEHEDGHGLPRPP